MTLLAAYIANLTGAAPVEGQKPTLANATGAGGLFAALVEANGTLQVKEGENAPILNPFGLPATPATEPETTQLSAENSALREALTQGLGLPQDGAEIEAVIIENPGTGNSSPANPIFPAAVPDTGVLTQPPEDGQSQTPVQQQTPIESQVPAPAAPVPDAPVQNTAIATQVKLAAEVNADQAQAQPANQRSGISVQTSETETSRQSGVESGANGASQTARESALQVALNRAAQTNGQPSGAQTASTAKQGDEISPGVRNPEQRGLDQRPASDIPANVKQGDTRAQFAARGPEIVKAVVKPGSGQTLIRFQKFSAGDPTLATTPPTLTVNVQANAAPPGPASANTPHVPVSALAVNIATQANNGARRFEIRLDPPELGRIEVRLNIARDGQVQTHLVVERSETLELLQRDARQLERALQDAGLDTSEENMKFSLKDQGLAHGGKDQDECNEEFASLTESDGDDLQDVSNDPMPPPIRYVATTGLDIQI